MKQSGVLEIAEGHCRHSSLCSPREAGRILLLTALLCFLLPIMLRANDEMSSGAEPAVIQLPSAEAPAGKQEDQPLSVGDLNPASVGHISFAWSPDGSVILYERPQRKGVDIFRIYADRTNNRGLTKRSTYDGNPLWSPDGSRIAFISERDGNAEIYLMTADGATQWNITNNAAKDWFQSWSPDGKEIAFVSDRDGNSEIYLMISNGQNPRNLTNTPAEDWNPQWFPNGSRIMFQSSRDGNWELYAMDGDGANQQRLTENASYDWSPQISPDGERIVFVSDRDGNPEIYTMNSDGSNQQRLTNDFPHDTEPRWSPDGRSIVFTSRRDGNSEVYVMNSDGSNARNVSVSSFDDFSPEWSPNGKNILYYSSRETANKIFLVDVDGGSRVELLPEDRPLDKVLMEFMADAGVIQLEFGPRMERIIELHYGVVLGKTSDIMDFSLHLGVAKKFGKKGFLSPFVQVQKSVASLSLREKTTVGRSDRNTDYAKTSNFSFGVRLGNSVSPNVSLGVDVRRVNYFDEDLSDGFMAGAFFDYTFGGQ